MNRVAVLLSFVAVVSCGGPSQNAEGPRAGDAGTAAPPPPEDPERERALAKLKRAQFRGCEGMCEILGDCAVADARANMPADEAEELAKLAPKHYDECMSKCAGAELSVRQVSVMHECLRAEAAECRANLECFERVSRGGQ